MEDRFYSNRYYINRPPKPVKRQKYWIYLAISSLFLLLTGIVLLVIFLMPKHKMSTNTRIRQIAEEELNRFHAKTTLPPRDYNIDPRSDLFDHDMENETEIGLTTPDSVITTSTTFSYTKLVNSWPGPTSNDSSSDQEVKFPRRNGRFNKTLIW